MIMNLFLFFCMLVLSACMPFGVWCRVVVLVGYRLQWSGAALLIVVGDVVGMVMLGASEVMGGESGW